MKRKYQPWYQTRGLKHVTGFVTPGEKSKLRQLARAADKSLSRYITRILQHHIGAAESAKSESKLSEKGSTTKAATINELSTERTQRN